MKKVSTVLLFLVSFHILSGWAAVPVYAQANQAAFAGNLILKKTYIKTAGPVSLTRTEWVEAFTPTTVLCPGEVATTCTLRIELSAQFVAVPVGTAAAALVLVDSSDENIKPQAGAALEPGRFEGSGADFHSARTFTWMVPNVTAGRHRVTIAFILAVSDPAAPVDDSAQSFSRTVTISVYKR
jgi:hypothetical protein